MSVPGIIGLGDLDLWGIHVSRCKGVVRRALELLSENPPAPPFDEVALNRELYWCILAAQRELGAQGNAPLAPVIPEGKNAPAAADHERAVRENKIPDFQWGLTDHQVADVRESAKHYVVECKCLMPPRRRDWIYTEQYVIAGIARFVSKAHGYGEGVADGAMVGYVHQLSFDQAVAEVGAHLEASGLAAMDEIAREADVLLTLSHALPRPFEVSPFTLEHLWRCL